jgi:hypothetical protein
VGGSSVRSVCKETISTFEKRSQHRYRSRWTRCLGYVCAFTVDKECDYKGLSLDEELGGNSLGLLGRVGSEECWGLKILKVFAVED